MHGLGLFFLRGRERLSAFLTAILCLVTIPFVAGEPRRTVVDGHEVVQGVLFGHIVPDWVFFAVFLPYIGALWFGIHRLLDRLWPEKKTVAVDKAVERPDGGFVAWKGDDHNAGSPLDDAAPQIRTARDYLRAEEPFSLCVLNLGAEDADEERLVFNRELERWRREATATDLNELVPAFRSMSNRPENADCRLTEAHEARGIPTLVELRDLAESTENEILREYVAVKQDSSE